MKKIFRKNMILRVLIWIVTIVWMGGIYFLSDRPVEQSLQDSSKVMEVLNLAPSVEEASDTTNAQMLSIQMYIRKQAHVILYMGLAGLIFLSLYGYFGKSEITALISFVLTILYAASDEIHQIFSNRGAQVRDVIIDARGAVWGIFFALVIFVIIENIPKFREWVDKFYKLEPR